MQENLGQIISFQGTPSTSKAYFVLNNGEVNRGQFLKIKNKKGFFFCFVNDIFRSNPYFENAMHVNEDTSNTFPVEDWHSTIVELKILGFLKTGKICRVSFPPYPGENVTLPTREELELFLGLIENGLELGTIENTDAAVKVDVSKLLQKHLAILAMSGAGKSYFVSVLLEELLDKSKLGIVLFDVHGEYKHFARPTNEFKDYSNKTKVIDCSKFKIAIDSIGIITRLIPDLSEVQKRALVKIISELRDEVKDSGLFTVGNIIERVDSEELKLAVNVRDSLIAKLRHIDSLDLFGKTSNLDVDMVSANTLTILDLSNVLDMQRKQLIVSYITEFLFNSRLKGTVIPHLIILEEAHQFIPEKASSDYAIARHIFETIAREGRKFGSALCLVSQRPINLSTTVLSQCNTHVFLRIINPNDLKHISESSEGLDYKTTEFITGLRVGEALMVGNAVKYPVFFKVREKKSQPQEYDFTLEEMAEKFTKKKDKKEKDLDLYLGI
ncbi:MAG: ATP-binding protein [Candidatus ainarchaeum sp.]|nr:ATP-binding protein [Candidatus ainarchaeum sp.]